MAEASILSSKPKRRDINKYHRELEDVWYSFGIELDVEDEKLDDLKEKYSDPHERLIKIFVVWLNEGENPTYASLIKALVNIDKKDIAQSLCTDLGLTSSLDCLLSTTSQAKVSECSPVPAKETDANIDTQALITDQAPQKTTASEQIQIKSPAASHTGDQPIPLHDSSHQEQVNHDSAHASDTTDHSQAKREWSSTQRSFIHDSNVQVRSPVAICNQLIAPSNSSQYFKDQSTLVPTNNLPSTSTGMSSVPSTQINEPHLIINRYFDKLVMGLSPDPLGIAMPLLAKGLIPENTADQMRLPSIPSNKACELVTVVRQRLEVAPKRFQDFIEVLLKETWTEDIVEILQVKDDSADASACSTKTNESYQIMLRYNNKLANALSADPLGIAQSLLAKGLIPENTAAQMQLSSTPYEKACILVAVIRQRVGVAPKRFQDFIEVLSEQTWALQPLITEHPQYGPALIKFTGPLATQKFRNFDRDFFKDLSACNVVSVMSKTEETLSDSMISIDYQCICLVHRAKCKAHCLGQRDEALLDCDDAIKRARNLKCENGLLIIGRALAMKASILRWSGRLDEALKCVHGGKGQFCLAAPSSDTAALLYEEVRMKICIAMSKGKDVNVYISQLQNDYDRIKEHFKLPCLDVYDRSRLCAYVNANAELYLRTYYLNNKLPFSAIPLPTDSDLRKAEEILNLYRLKELPTKPHGNIGWYYRNRGDLCMWRMQYCKAIKWAIKARDQFTQANMTHITYPTERIELYQRLQMQQMKANKNKQEQKQRLAFIRYCKHIKQFRRSSFLKYAHLLHLWQRCQHHFPRRFRQFCCHS